MTSFTGQYSDIGFAETSALSAVLNCPFLTQGYEASKPITNENLQPLAEKNDRFLRPAALNPAVYCMETLISKTVCLLKTCSATRDYFRQNSTLSHVFLSATPTGTLSDVSLLLLDGQFDTERLRQQHC